MIQDNIQANILDNIQANILDLFFVFSGTLPDRHTVIQLIHVAVLAKDL